MNRLTTLALLALVVWLLPSSPEPRVAIAGDRNLSGDKLVQRDSDEHEHPHLAQKHDRDNEWYQGQRGHWDKDDHDQWRWHGERGDEWYQGQRGHWYQEANGPQFASDNLVCDDQCRNCRRGGYIPANGEGMVSRGHPNVCWVCDAEGHKCHWARRPR